jgi:hypothetical protein
MRGILQFDRSGILLIQQDFGRSDCPQMGTAVHAGATLGRVGGLAASLFFDSH